MVFRIAHIQDILQIYEVRSSVGEVHTYHADLFTSEIIAEYLQNRGKGWVCAINEHLIGFAIVDLFGEHFWALFVRPEFQGIGVGKRLHDLSLAWYFGQGKEKIWADVPTDIAANRFFQQSGWMNFPGNATGIDRWEMTNANWKNRKSSHFAGAS